MSVSYGGDSIVFADGSVTSSGWTGFKNKIINGAITIDQRYSGASANNVASNLYIMDRWAFNGQVANLYKAQQVNGANTAAANYESGGSPAGFQNSIKVTSLSAYTTLTGTLNAPWQAIEGYNVADLNWGTANAIPLTVSFWTKCSVTGTYSVSALNADATRSYGTTYTINQANTWEYKTVTIPGDQTGTWGKGNGIGIYLFWALSAGSTYTSTTNNTWEAGGKYSATGCTQFTATNAATWYMTGAQAERGSTASSFEYRPYGTELQLCQRYYEKSFDLLVKPASNLGHNQGALNTGAWSTSAYAVVATTTYAVRKRAIPSTVTFYNTYASGSGWSRSGSGNYAASAYSSGESSLGIRCDASIGSVDANMSIQWTADAEL